MAEVSAITPPAITARIYILRSDKTPQVYIGSTTKTLPHRFSHHVCDYHRFIGGDKRGSVTSRP